MVAREHVVLCRLWGTSRDIPVSLSTLSLSTPGLQRTTYKHRSPVDSIALCFVFLFTLGGGTVGCDGATAAYPLVLVFLTVRLVGRLLE